MGRKKLNIERDSTCERICAEVAENGKKSISELLVMTKLNIDMKKIGRYDKMLEK